MSTPPVQAPCPISSYRPDQPYPAPVADDPLLRNGSFIVSAAIKRNTNDDDSNCGTRNQQQVNSETTPLKSRRKVPVTMAVAPPCDSANWLPPGWLVEDRVRTSGATAGTVDKYYIDLVSGRRFRSKKEVQYYLETGTLKKKKKGAENSEADANLTENSSSQKNTKKTGKKAKIHEKKFDYLNVPDRVDWALTDAQEDSWTPFIGGVKVSEYERQTWDFEMLHIRH